MNEPGNRLVDDLRVSPLEFVSGCALGSSLVVAPSTYAGTKIAYLSLRLHGSLVDPLNVERVQSQL